MISADQQMRVTRAFFHLELDADAAPSVGRAAECRMREGWFLLHRTRAGDPTSFVTHTLEQLLRHFSFQTDRVSREYRGRVRGKVAWPETIKRRYTSGHDPTIFVCREVKRDYDTPENQLLRFFLARIEEMVRRVPPVMRGGWCFYPGALDDAGASIDDDLQPMRAALARLHRDARIRSISLPAKITERHLVRTESSKLEAYAVLAELFRRYRACVHGRTWDGIGRLARVMLPLPEQPDGEGEPWVRFAAAARQHAVRAAQPATAMRVAGSPRIT